MKERPVPKRVEWNEDPCLNLAPKSSLGRRWKNQTNPSELSKASMQQEVMGVLPGLGNMRMMQQQALALGVKYLNVICPVRSENSAAVTTDWIRLPLVHHTWQQASCCVVWEHDEMDYKQDLIVFGVDHMVQPINVTRPSSATRIKALLKNDDCSSKIDFGLQRGWFTHS